MKKGVEVLLVVVVEEEGWCSRWLRLRLRQWCRRSRRRGGGGSSGGWGGGGARRIRWRWRV